MALFTILRAPSGIIRLYSFRELLKLYFLWVFFLFWGMLHFLEYLVFRLVISTFSAWNWVCLDVHKADILEGIREMHTQSFSPHNKQNGAFIVLFSVTAWPSFVLELCPGPGSESFFFLKYLFTAVEVCHRHLLHGSTRPLGRYRLSPAAMELICFRHGSSTMANYL